MRDSPTIAVLEEIARDNLGVATLETRNSDSDDFHECAVWALRQALKDAYESGWRDGYMRVVPSFPKEDA